MSAADWLSAGLCLTALLGAALAAWLLREWRQRRGTLILLPALWATVVWAAVEPLARAWPFIQPSLQGPMDAARYAVWFVTLGLVFRRGQGVSTRPPWFDSLAALLVLALPSWAAVSSDALAFTLLPVVGLILIEQVYRGIGEAERWAIKPLCLGLSGVFLFDFYAYSEVAVLGQMDVATWTARGYVHALMLPFIWWVGVRQSHWVSRLQVSRHVAFHSLAASVAGAYLLLIALVGYYARTHGGDAGRAFQQALLFFACVLLVAVVFSGTWRAKVRVWLGKHFFRYRYDYREEWLNFTRALSSHDTPESLNLHVIRGLANMVESPGGGLWLQGRHQDACQQVAAWNMAMLTAPETPDGALMRFMASTGWVVNLAEWRQHPARYASLEMPDWLLQLPSAWLVVPLMTGGDWVGFVVLNAPRTEWDVNWEVTDLLKTAASQAASVLAQVRANDALLEAQKFEAFNRMSAFVVHDLKNIVTQLSLMTRNAQRLKANPEFQDDMIMTVDHALDRMRQLMLQLREGSSPAVGGALGVDLAAIVRDASVQAQVRGREVSLELAEGLMARGHEERLRRVIGHLVQNALDATEGNGGGVVVRSWRLGSQACVEVHDNGVGMTGEFVRTRLFKPFQTTKTAGMGIGAFESAQYVQELGGSMTVDSEVGQGTTIRCLLPIFETGALGSAGPGATT